MWAPCETVIYYTLYAMYTKHFLFHTKLFYILAAKIKEKKKVFFKIYIYLPTQENRKIKQHCTYVKMIWFYFLLQDKKPLFQAALQVIMSPLYLPLTDVLSCAGSS